MSYLGTQLASKEEKAKLTEIFKQFDANADGQLSREELIAGYAQMYGSKAKAIFEVDQIFQKVDLNGNGTVDYSEFLIANTQYNDLMTNEKLRAAFAMFDLVSHYAHSLGWIRNNHT